MKKAILQFSSPLYSLVALILMGCSTSNAICFDIDSQCVYPIKGSMKYIEVSKVDGDCVFSVLFEPGDGEARKLLPIQNLEPGHIYRISNSGGDRGPFEIYVETDSSGKGIHVMEWDELPSVFLLTQKNLNPVLKRNSMAAINGHIDEERARECYNYPDSVLCAGIWLDFRGEADSLYVLGGPMSLYDDDPDTRFLGYAEGTRWTSITGRAASDSGFREMAERAFNKETGFYDTDIIMEYINSSQGIITDKDWNYNWECVLNMFVGQPFSQTNGNNGY